MTSQKSAAAAESFRVRSGRAAYVERNGEAAARSSITLGAAPSPLPAAVEDRGLVDGTCGAPRDDLVERAPAADADVVLVEATVANARRSKWIERRSVHARQR